jgi:hypothetical protein
LEFGQMLVFVSVSTAQWLIFGQGQGIWFELQSSSSAAKCSKQPKHRAFTLA